MEPPNPFQQYLFRPSQQVPEALALNNCTVWIKCQADLTSVVWWRYVLVENLTDCQHEYIVPVACKTVNDLHRIISLSRWFHIKTN